MMKIIESPREAMQGFSRIIPTPEKVLYINSLLKAGFDTVETGSIVSPKIIPQMADSLEVNAQITSETNTNRMMLAVSMRGAEVIAELPSVSHLSYPFSFTPTFLKLNANTTVEKSLETVEKVVELCGQSKKSAVIYISMAFGNPYGDAWSLGMLVDWVGRLFDKGVRIIPLSNVSTEIDAEMISVVYSTLIKQFPEVEFGLHLHTANHGWFSKVDAAWQAGCRRYDGVVNGWGGCPMAGKEMLGNLKTENLISFAKEKGVYTGIHEQALWEVYRIAGEVFREELNN